MRGSPWPVSILGIGDSYTSSANPDWVKPFKARWPSVTIVNEATSGKCLFDTTGGLGADTVEASITGDLAANPNADIVVWATACLNDILRNKQLLNSITLTNLQTAATSVMNQVQTEKKGLIVMAPPHCQALISGFGAGDDTSATNAYILRRDFNTWMVDECAKRGSFYYFDMRPSYIDLGPITATGGNGLTAEYGFGDGLHYGANGNDLLCTFIMGCIGNMNKRKAAA